MELSSSNLNNGRWSSREFQKKIAKFVYRKGIDLHTIKSNDFREVVQFIDGHEAYGTPNSNDLNGWILEEVQEEIDGYIKDVKASWKDTGCSIVLDGWEDGTGSHMINVLVSSPKGTIYVTSIYHNDNDDLQMLLEQILVDIGVENVVQIISHSASQMMKELGQSLVDKYQTFFWTVSVSHCIELILKEIEKMDLVADVMEKAKLITRFIHGNGSVLKLIKAKVSKDGLIKPSIIRSTVPYLTLMNMDNLRPNLEKVFLSKYWLDNSWASTEKGKQCTALIIDNSFWCGLRQVVIAVMPLVDFQSWMHDIDNHAGFIYKRMDQIKERIRSVMSEASLNHTPYWDAIDYVWEEHLHSPLHAAGYSLNPALRFGEDFNPDEEVSFGLFNCAACLVKDIGTIRKFFRQLDKYRRDYRKGAFGKGVVEDARILYSSSPAAWWLNYGEDYPELQQFAIRVLSQTCDGALKFCLEKKMAEKLFYVKRNDTDQERHCLLTSIHYNLCLQNFKPAAAKEISIYDIDGIQDWTLDEALQPTTSSSLALVPSKDIKQNFLTRKWEQTY